MLFIIKLIAPILHVTCFIIKVKWKEIRQLKSYREKQTINKQF